MRDEVFSFTVRGAGKKPHEMANRGPDDGRTRPPAVAFALRGSATRDGAPLLAQDFALLDAKTAHRHTALFVRHPEGAPSFAVVGWAGIIWGFSGLNARGLGVACNYSDTLDNSVVAGLLDQLADQDGAKLLARGTPIGITLRSILGARRRHRRRGDFPERDRPRQRLELPLRRRGGRVARGGGGLGPLLRTGRPPTAPNRRRPETSIRLDAPSPACAGTTPDEQPLKLEREPFASVRGDDPRSGAHFQKNVQDIYALDLGARRIVPQRFWNSCFHRSPRAFDLLGEAIETGYGRFDADRVLEVPRTRNLADQRDGMNAVILEPRARRSRVAMGQVPPAGTPFEVVELEGGCDRHVASPLPVAGPPPWGGVVPRRGTSRPGADRLAVRSTAGNSPPRGGPGGTPDRRPLPPKAAVGRRGLSESGPASMPPGDGASRLREAMAIRSGPSDLADQPQDGADPNPAPPAGVLPAGRGSPTDRQEAVRRIASHPAPWSKCALLADSRRCRCPTLLPSTPTQPPCGSPPDWPRPSRRAASRRPPPRAGASPTRAAST